MAMAIHVIVILHFFSIRNLYWRKKWKKKHCSLYILIILSRREQCNRKCWWTQTLKKKKGKKQRISGTHIWKENENENENKSVSLALTICVNNRNVKVIVKMYLFILSSFLLSILFMRERKTYLCLFNSQFLTNHVIVMFVHKTKYKHLNAFRCWWSAAQRRSGENESAIVMVVVATATAISVAALSADWSENGRPSKSFIVYSNSSINDLYLFFIFSWVFFFCLQCLHAVIARKPLDLGTFSYCLLRLH